MIAGLASGSGKTMVTLGLLRALARRGKAPAAGKTGPDYIDPGFLSAAAGRKAVNLDQFAMSKPLLAHLAANQAGDTLIIEGVMGLLMAQAAVQAAAPPWPKPSIFQLFW